MEIKAGDNAPLFRLTDQDGRERSLQEWSGKWLLIYFYPKDDTPGCTQEACLLQSRLPDFSRRELSVVGISVDSVDSHLKFAQKYRLGFPLLADVNQEVVRSYGVWGLKKFMGKEYMGIIRRSFLLDPKGRIVKVYPKVDPKMHAEEVWQDIRSLSGGDPVS